ncbi:hypothetical protein [Kitasatospora sp. NPDC057198]|uniref:hypothetical protein n=1 Tax=Kitasatospora sp. NPDC057198 TaxID=3346046 RepID=UPI003624D1FB
MAKLSVSVPDALLEQAQTLHPGDSPSQLVQRSLTVLTADRENEPHRPDGAEISLVVVGERLRAAAREDYEEGYRAGLELAKQAPWDWLVWLNRRKYQLTYLLNIQWRMKNHPDLDAEREMNRACRGARWPDEWYLALCEAFPGEMNDGGEEESPNRSDQFLSGAKQAFRDVWGYATQDIRQ